VFVASTYVIFLNRTAVNLVKHRAQDYDLILSKINNPLADKANSAKQKTHNWALKKYLW
jgi:hypothetical protein